MPTERAGARAWLGLAVLALPTILVSLDIGVLFLALPHLSAALGADGTQQLWITDMYGFTLSGFLVLMGAVGDRVGRRRLLLGGALLFGAASLLAAYAPGPEALIAARALLGVAGAAMLPSTLSLVRTLFEDPGQRGVAISIWVSCMMTGAALGPVVGGALLQHFWWGSVFLLAVPVMLVLLVAAPVLLPEYRRPGTGGVDAVSALLSLGTVLPVVYGLKEFAVHGTDSPWVPLGSVLAGVLVGAVFVRRQLVVDDPLLDLRLFSSRRFSAALVSLLLAGVVLAGTFLLVSQYVQSVAGLTPARSGLWLAPAGAAVAIGSLSAPPLARLWSQHAVVAVGLLLGAVGFALVATAPAEGGVFQAVAGTSLAHLGAGPLLALGAAVVVGSAPPDRAGSAAAMSETANHFGSALGLAAMGTLGAVVFGERLSSTLPDGLSAGADGVGETLPGALDTAASLTGRTADDLATAAQEAFTLGMNAVALSGVVVFVALAALGWAALREQRPADPATAESEPA
ncbi:MFS transporter [Nocardiopsis sp. NPDC058631]|uniref:MFS transporter n=1 Tax=Nocardiopsis sp. NPDC058631 TaxID=3346566 RepID=UPI003664669B